MRIYIIYTQAGPYKVYLDQTAAYKEYNRLKKLDDYVNYSVADMPVEEIAEGSVKLKLKTSQLRLWRVRDINRNKGKMR